MLEILHCLPAWILNSELGSGKRPSTRACVACQCVHKIFCPDQNLLFAMSKLLVKWANFGFQMSEIRTAIVFGKNGGNVIIVLENDEVLAFGENQDGCLGTGVEFKVNELKRIENLCGQRIEGFEYGVILDDDSSEFSELRIFIFAISGSGSAFSWGENDFGQLGLGIKQYTKVPTKISGLLEHKKVVQVACGSDHTLALTSEGEVYAFGRNNYGQLGLGTTNDHWLPQRVGGLLDGKIVTSVACQAFSSIALLHSGKICAWGFNRGDMLSLSSTSEHECSPCKVIGLKGIVISKIACGLCFTLALSNVGETYSWGVFSISESGQNGLERPFIISKMMGRVKDIAATHYESHPCAAINEKNQVYIWGSCNGSFDLNPMLTSLSSFDDVYAVSSPPVIYKRFPCNIAKDEIKRKDPVIKRFPEVLIFETADITFIVEGKKIHVHKIILILGSDVFKNLFLGDWEDSSKKEQIVEKYSYNAFYAFLKYFYTDDVDFTPELALEIYAIAHFYLVTGLMEECETILKSGLTEENAAAIYEKAILFGAKGLCDFCFKYCRENLLRVVDNLESDESKSQVLLDVFRRAANQKKN
ncbi:RCC1 and BTB domain-containing protein 1-like [Cloeon dipterum]|uniref:RCC1 and BTB domain-containing protein 1-like n=1 Tax=Cloeon dipterum TaxID=197152 RepID=UPI00321F9CD6